MLKTAKQPHNNTSVELKIVKRHAKKEHRFKSVDVFLIKKNASEIADIIEKHGHLIEADNPSAKYFADELWKINKKIKGLKEFTGIYKDN